MGMKAASRTFIENRLVRFPIHRFNDLNSYLNAGSGKVWASFRACHACASVIQSTAFRVSKEGDGDWEAPENDPARMLLRTPNPFDTWNEMLYMWTYHMKLTGQAFWMKDEMNLLGQPLALYPLLPQFMQIVPDQKKNIGKFVYKVNGRELELEPDEVVYFRRPHPKDLRFGMGDIEPSEALYNDYINRATYSEKFMENGAQPSGVLSLKTDGADVDDEDFGTLKTKWMEEYGGKNNAGKTAFLTGEWSYHQLGLSQADMQSIERDKLTTDQIFMNHGVPLSIVGMGSANHATARLEEMNFRKYEIVPLLRLLIGKLNREDGVFPAFSSDYRLEFNLSGLIDVEQVMKDYLPLVKAGGMTLNELREKAGLEKSENVYLDQFFIPSNVVPIEMAGMSAAMPSDEELEALAMATTGQQA